ncbi:MAG TPA: VIT1/CCC1 transporter family protein, partial [Thermoplasmataceae archaeon]|nr:VIT1/CCC1 transporter family protein [Thermoplasmataceae archaeon]
RIEKYSKQSKKSAASVGGSYIIGAVVPILPFVFFPPITGLIISVVLVAISQAITNALVALSMNIGILRSSLKASLLSLSAAAAVFALGELFHIVFGITLL